MPPAVADEGQKSIMSFFKKVCPACACGSAACGLLTTCVAWQVDLKSAATATPAASSGAGSKSPSAQECADLSSAATPTVAQKVVKTPAAVYPGSAGSSAEKKGKRKSDSNSSSSAKSAKSARESQKDTATSSRPSRASKSRAQEQLKERDYSSDSLMEESEDEAEAAAHTRDTAEEQEEKTPAAASSLRRGGRKVRFSIDGEDELEKAVGGDFSPIAINDDDDVECLGDVVDTDKQEAERVARQRAALDAVEGELTTLQYDKGASKIENASVVETPKVTSCVTPCILCLCVCM